MRPVSLFLPISNQMGDLFWETFAVCCNIELKTLECWLLLEASVSIRIERWKLCIFKAVAYPEASEHNLAPFRTHQQGCYQGRGNKSEGRLGTTKRSELPEDFTRLLSCFRDNELRIECNDNTVRLSAHHWCICKKLWKSRATPTKDGQVKMKHAKSAK